METNSFYSSNELISLGLKSIGENVLISRFARIYGAENIDIGNNVRIDDFCILSGKIKLESNIHISAYCSLYGANGIEIQEYSGLSPRCTIFSATDDFSGDFLVGPLVRDIQRNIIGGKVKIMKYSQIGANCIVLPNVVIGEGVAVGSMSLINRSLEEWGIYVGVPLRKLRDRKKGLLDKI